MYCKNCGIQIKISNKFCTNCGQVIKFEKFTMLQVNLFNWFKSHHKKIIIIAVIIFFVGGKFYNIFLSNQTSHDSKNISSYNQNEITASVVNIFCPSTKANEATSGGSGTIINEDGLILTNSHIIPQDKKYLHVDETGCLVVLPDPTTGHPSGLYLAHPIVLSNVSNKYDLAYMNIYAAYHDTEYTGEAYPRKFPTFNDKTICKNQNIQLGEPVRIFGYPAISGGYSLTVTDGIVSSFPSDGLIVTSAKISHGNSGGLAIDKNGCMIGVPSLVNSDETESLGIIYSMDLLRQFDDEATKSINNFK